MSKYSKVSTSDQDEALEMEPLNVGSDYSSDTEETEKVERGVCFCLSIFKSCWTIIITANRFRSCVKLILFVLLVSGVLFEGKVQYDDHNRINSLMDNSTTPGDNVTTHGRHNEAAIEQHSKDLLQLKTL